MSSQKVIDGEVLVDVYVSRRKAWDGEYMYEVSTYDHSTHSKEYIPLGLTTMAVPVPSEKEMIQIEVAQLHEAMRKVHVQAAEDIASINEALSKLMCITDNSQEADSNDTPLTADDVEVEHEVI